MSPRFPAFPDRFGVAIEIDIFAELIKRPEPRNMIQTLFAGKLEFEKRSKAGTLPDALARCIDDIRSAIEAITVGEGPVGPAASRFAGFAVSREGCFCA